MGARLRWQKSKDLLPRVSHAVKEVAGKRVNVGVTGPHAHLARIHEFGCNIPVTPRMRAYLHGIGVHLRGDTVRIVIPERSFLRSGYDAARGGAARRAAQVFLRAAGGGPAHLEEVGRALAEAIRNHAKAGVPPPKRAFPGNGAGPALVDTGAMLDGIDYEIE